MEQELALKAFNKQIEDINKKDFELIIKHEDYVRKISVKRAESFYTNNQGHYYKVVAERKRNIGRKIFSIKEKFK